MMVKTEPSKASVEADPLAEAVYLQAGVTLTDDDKVNYYDGLKEKYSEMLKKVDSFKKKCSYIDRQVRTLEKVKCKSKPKKKVSYIGQNTTSEQFEAIVNDGTIPSGWKSSWRIMHGFSKGSKVRVFWPPNGRFCASRVSALNYMTTALNSSEEDVEIMRTGLVSEGWAYNESLPEGWMVNDDPQKNKRFVTSEFHFLKNIKVTVKHMGLLFSESDLGKFIIAFSLKSDNSACDLEWLHSDSIPYPWKAAHIKNKSGLLVVSPDGKVFTGSFKIVQEFIEKSGDISPDDLENFRAFVMNEKNQGKLMKILDRKVNLKDSVDSTSSSEKVEMSHFNTEKPFIKTERLIKAEKDQGVDLTPKSQKSKNSKLVWKDDWTAPPGWKSSIPEECPSFGKRFRDIEGKTFQGRLDALRNMIKNNEQYSEGDIEVMKKGLLTDGWCMSDSLPEGWMLKKIKINKENASQRHVYLNPSFEIMETFEKVFIFMKENKFSEEEISNFKAKNGLNWKSEKHLPAGWTFAVVTTERQGKLKRFLDPKGKFWNSSAQAIKNCFATDPNGEEVMQMRKYLLNGDGWFETEYLPERWMMRQKRSERGFYFLNSVYEKFNTTKAMYAHLRANKYGEQIVSRFDNNYKKLQMPLENLKKEKDFDMIDEFSEGDASMNNDDDSFDMDTNENEEDEDPVGLEWRNDINLPIGWMLATTEIQEGKLAGTIFKRYMSPCGNFFGNLPEALKFVENDESTSELDLEFMRKGLYSEGWGEAESMPSDWLSIQVKGKGKTFLSPTFDTFTKNDEILEYMTNNNYTEDEIERFKEINTKIQWEKDGSVPPGWKINKINGEHGEQTKTFLSPQGTVFNNRPHAIKHMLESDSFRNEDITQMQLALIEDGWVYDENLPPGWLKNKYENSWKFLTTKYEVLNSITLVSEYFLKNKTSQDVVSKFNSNLGRADEIKTPIISNTVSPLALVSSPNRKQEVNQSNVQALLPGVTISKVQHQQRNTSSPSKDSDQTSSAKPNEHEQSPKVGKLEWNTDSYLPEGWKLALQNVKGSTFARFMSPSQKYFGSRLQAIQYMAKSGLYQQQQIDQMKKSFENDGYSYSATLPDAWMSKGTSYLTHTLEKLSSNESVMKFLKEDGYQPAEIQKFFENISDNISWNYDDSLPEGWKLAETEAGFDHSKKWFKYMSPDGKVMTSRAQAIRYMITEDKYNEKDIVKMKNNIQNDGWTVSPNLPPGWYQKKKDQTHIVYLTPSFETLKSLKNVISYMKMKNYDPATIRNFKPNSIFSDSIQETPIKRKLEEAEENLSPMRKSPRTEIGNEEGSSEPYKTPRTWTLNQKDKNSIDWKSGDFSLPEGWKHRFNKDSQTNQILTTHGHVFNDRAEAFKYMMEHKDTYNNSEIEEIIEKLVHEDWITNQLLPSGWKLKKIQGSVYFLSEYGSLMRVVKSARAKIKKNYSDIALKNFSLLINSLQPNNKEVLINYLKQNKKESDPPKSKPTNSNNSSPTFIKLEPKDREEEPKDPLDMSDIEPQNNLEDRYSFIASSKIKQEKIVEPEENKKHNVKVKKEPLPYVYEKDNENETLPPGWKMETDENSEEVIVNSEGKKFPSRREAVQFMIKNNLSPKSIYNLWNSLDKEGWILESDLIPPGWRIKFHPRLYDYKYLTREMRVLHGTEEACRLIKESHEYDQENEEKFYTWVAEVKKSSPKIVWKMDSSLPSGWLLSIGLQKEIIKDSKGSLFEGRKEAIDHMIKEHCSPTDIFKLWNTLHLEGWISDEENLPTGWKRKYFSEKKRHHYLSPMMEVVKSSTNLLNIVKAGKEYSGEEIKKVNKWMDEESSTNIIA